MYLQLHDNYNPGMGDFGLTAIIAGLAPAVAGAGQQSNWLQEAISGLFWDEDKEREKLYQQLKEQNMHAETTLMAPYGVKDIPTMPIDKLVTLIDGPGKLLDNVKNSAAAAAAATGGQKRVDTRYNYVFNRFLQEAFAELQKRAARGEKPSSARPWESKAGAPPPPPGASSDKLPAIGLAIAAAKLLGVF